MQTRTSDRLCHCGAPSVQTLRLKCRPRTIFSGSRKKCSLRLSCGHSCTSKCHSESLHNAVICLEPCPRSKAGCDYLYPQPCGEECEQVCYVKVPNVTLLCGHVRTRLESYKARDLKVVRCEKQIERHVPRCEHTIKTPCYVNVERRISSAVPLVKRFSLAATLVLGNAKIATLGLTGKLSKATIVHVKVMWPAVQQLLPSIYASVLRRRVLSAV